MFFLYELPYKNIPHTKEAKAQGPLNLPWLGGLLVERRTSVSQIRGSIPGQVAAV